MVVRKQNLRPSAIEQSLSASFLVAKGEDFAFHSAPPPGPPLPDFDKCRALENRSVYRLRTRNETGLQYTINITL